MSAFTEDYKAKKDAGYRFVAGTIPFPVYHVTGVEVEELNLSTRAHNGLKRAGINTIDEILEKNLSNMRNLGVKSIKEIKNAVLNYSYDRLTDKQKAEFWNTVLR